MARRACARGVRSRVTAYRRSTPRPRSTPLAHATVDGRSGLRAGRAQPRDGVPTLDTSPALNAPPWRTGGTSWRGGVHRWRLHLWLRRHSPSIAWARGESGRGSGTAMADEAANDEDYVRLSFKDRFGVELRKIPEGEDPTPDFELLAGAARAAVVEMKCLQETPRTPGKNGWRPLRGGGMERMDKGPPRVAADIYKAWRQLQTSEAPKILVFVNNEPLLDVGDL